MKKCDKCGASNQENARFCRECGNKLFIQKESKDSDELARRREQIQKLRNESDKRRSDINNEEKQAPHSGANERNDAACPFCHEPGCHPLEKSITESETTGYKWGSGCCGMFLMGPFGLLCGLCGTGSKTKTTTETWWACTKCGKKHIALTSAINKWETVVSSLPATGLSIGIAALITKAVAKWFVAWMFGTGFIGGVLTFFAATIAPVLMALVGVAAGMAAWKSDLNEDLGSSLDLYLSEEQAEQEKTMTIVSTVIAVVVTIFALPLLRSVLG